MTEISGHLRAQQGTVAIYSPLKITEEKTQETYCLSTVQTCVIFFYLETNHARILLYTRSTSLAKGQALVIDYRTVAIPSQTFSPRYATFSPVFASFVTLSPRCSLSPHIIDNYATLCNIICQLNYRRKNGCSRR